MNKDKVIENIKNWLAGEGFESGAYGWDPILHTKGMPGGISVMVKPDYPPEGDACTILVTPTEVIRMVIHMPFELSKWIVQYRWPYPNLDELRQLLLSLRYEEFGCWDGDDRAL